LVVGIIYPFLPNSLLSGYQRGYSGYLSNFRYIKINRVGAICGVWQIEYILFFWMLIGTDIFGYSKELEVLILKHFGKMIRV
jgi:hypothetical protein